ncbi:MAG: alpha/beta fold hydrolase [Terriglobales bacterium]
MKIWRPKCVRIACSTLILLAALIASTPLYAQDIAGDWQGTLKAGLDLRIIVHIEKGTSGGWTAMLYSIDQGPDGIPVTSVTLKDSILKFSVELVHGAYEGKLSADAQTVTGTWTQRLPLPLELRRATKETAWQRDSSSHTVQFVIVDTNVKLEVLDWGGSGRPLVFLAGLGNTAHVFDTFAPKFTGAHHVYGITRRGFGASSVPDSGYSADRLGDDVLAVLDALKINRPVLVGHSIAGEELSSVGTRHPEKIAGLVYLDAAYPYAFYDPALGDFNIDSLELQKKLDQLRPGRAQADPKKLIQDVLQSLPRLEKDLQEELKDLEVEPANARQVEAPAPAKAIIAGEQKYTEIRVPVLAIYALPHSGVPASSSDAAARAAAEARDTISTGAQAKAFEKGVPTARVVRLPNANHYVFRSNEADVLREVNAFLGSLP